MIADSSILVTALMDIIMFSASIECSTNCSSFSLVMKNKGPVRYTIIVSEQSSATSCPLILFKSTLLTSIFKSLFFITNVMIPKSTPIKIAMVRSNMTVATIVIANSKIAFPNFLSNMYFISFHSFMRQAVTIRTPASAAIGILEINFPRKSMDKRSPADCTNETILVCPPDLSPTLVLARTADAGIPPKNGIIMFPNP
ncbi:hypothetical protein SDC9_74404 [bioreactor metagenome]|uniref:Uncharacterized protein n=1 Tax=bioreactor metagenome TaxID=1076179 RepID=A0A644YHT6_9ZZZZ